MECSGDNRDNGDMEYHESSPDVSFAEGVARAVLRIRELLERKDVVMVGIDGSGCDVGKSYLFASLTAKLWLNPGIFCRSSVSSIGEDVRRELTEMKKFGEKKGVIIIKNAGLGACVPARIRRTYYEEKRGTGVDIDFVISIYSPSEPFENPLNCPGARPVGDIVIRNEGAKIKRR